MNGVGFQRTLNWEKREKKNEKKHHSTKKNMQIFYHVLWLVYNVSVKSASVKCFHRTWIQPNDSNEFCIFFRLYFFIQSVCEKHLYEHLSHIWKTHTHSHICSYQTSSFLHQQTYNSKFFDFINCVSHLRRTNNTYIRWIFIKICQIYCNFYVITFQTRILLSVKNEIANVFKLIFSR